ncbi:CCR4-Not complex component, Not1 [Ceratobasidium sp. AG-Ba]|nr:CCR4-Not complex component, Not1 [Ceratobasidium sp. AG-Ba]QRW14568.1 CCR4-Not complex component, Not1 [Ceratobasidium sp. AG-Ba]
MATMPRIREVWATNLDQEMHAIRSLVEQYPYISMDTEFPGVVARPIGTFKTSSDYHYQTMRCNVDLLKIIQIGLTLSDADGNMPEGICTWQFNFHFSVNEDMYSADSIEILQKAGLDFSRHEDSQYGIKPNDFAELLITSGLVLFENVKWISFHSGYDFGYLLRLLTNAPLPPVEEDFFELVHMWFPHILDIKYITRSIRATKGGLQELADELGVQRIGPLQQAGSDALLTSMTFFKMKEHYFPDLFDESKYSGQLYGLGPNYNPLASSPSAPTPAHVHHTAVSHNMNISLPGMTMQMNGMGSMAMGQPFPTPGLYPNPSVNTPFGPSGPNGPSHTGAMGGMGMGNVGMYGMPGHNVR